MVASTPIPQPLVLPEGDLVAGASISIPLHIFPLDSNISTSGYKVGIVVSLTNPEDKSQTTGPVMFEFDTGGQGFWADPQGSLLPPTSNNTIKITYDSGIEYVAVATPLVVAFPEASEALGATVTVGLIKEIKGSKQFPIFGHFYGDFGASLQGFEWKESSVLLTVMSQLPSPYNSGFIVDLGPYPGGPAPRVIAGLTDALRNSFPTTLPMAPLAAYLSPQTNQPVATFDEVLVTATVSPNPLPVGVVFDTGAPTTEMHQGSNLQPDEKPVTGQLFELIPTADSAFALISVAAGDTPGQDEINFPSKPSPIPYPDGYVNTGLIPFFNFPVMFDLANGLVRFPALIGG